MPVILLKMYEQLKTGNKPLSVIVASFWCNSLYLLLSHVAFLTPIFKGNKIRLAPCNTSKTFLTNKPCFNVVIIMFFKNYVKWVWGVSESPFIFSQIEMRYILNHCIPKNFMARERKKKKSRIFQEMIRNIFFTW